MGRSNITDEEAVKPETITKLYGIDPKSEWYKMEVRVGEILAKAGKEGLRVNGPALAEENKRLYEQLCELQSKVDDRAGRSVKVGSVKDLGKLLFTERGLKPIKKTKSGADSLDDSVLGYYAGDPLIDRIREWRTTRSTLSYLTKLTKSVMKDGRIYFLFLPWKCPTGRIYAKDINVQQIPVPGRKAIVPDGENLFFYIDYSQMEFRIMLSIAEEKDKFAFIERGGDVHALTAREIFDVHAGSTVSKEQRDIGKVLNYAISYGVGPETLSVTLKKSQAECKELIKKFFEKYPKVAEWIKRSHEYAKEHKCIRTIFGHTRDLSEELKTDKSSAMRMAVNTQIQGASAGYLKHAIYNVGALEDQGIKFRCCVHDSILMEVDKDQPKEAVENRVRNAVVFQPKDSLPLDVDMHWGKTWAECAHSEKK